MVEEDKAETQIREAVEEENKAKTQIREAVERNEYLLVFPMEYKGDVQELAKILIASTADLGFDPELMRYSLPREPDNLFAWPVFRWVGEPKTFPPLKEIMRGNGIPFHHLIWESE